MQTQTRLALGVATLLLAVPTFAQSITLPQVSPAASVSQSIGPVHVTIDYHSPSVNDRKGKIWGQLVPYGMQPTLGYGTCTQCPWRGGANENTVITVSDDVTVEGQKLAAGRYGLHFVPDANEWTVIFSKNSTSWGSFFYDASEDALRVKVKPVKNAFRENLTYDFVARGADKATVAMQWEELSVPFTIAVSDVNERYLANLRNELRGAAAGDWHNWYAAAQWALRNKVAPKEALTWAQTAVSGTYVGQETFTTLMTLAQAQEANGLATESTATRSKALASPTASAIDIHRYGRELMAAGKNDEAVKVFELNAKRNPNAWPVNVGLARGYKAVGRSKDAMKYAKLALTQAPDEVNREAIRGIIKELEGTK